ncbi:MAG: Polymer-forming cytoskeletal [Acidobacteria bacterium ADurb.Bin051]|nr:MAG: Polymer-forming cytoskeletal [Acidobacteria bacterium ADurb.Bin051]
MSTRERLPRGELNGFLDQGSELHGELRFEQTFRVEGRFVGEVVSEGDLMVAERGEVEGELRVGGLLVAGTVRGQVVASRRVEVGPGGRLLAEVETPCLVVADGAVLEGPCRMVKGE